MTTFVRDNTSTLIGSGSSGAVSIVATGAGNSLVVTISSDVSVTSITDAGGGTWTKDNSKTSGGLTAEIWCRRGGSSISTYTVNLSGATTGTRISTLEFANLAPLWYASPGESGTSTTEQTPTVTPPSDGALLVAAFRGASSGWGNPSNGWTATASNGTLQSSAYHLQTTAAADSTSWTNASSLAWVGATVVYAQAAAPSGIDSSIQMGSTPSFGTVAASSGIDSTIAVGAPQVTVQQNSWQSVVYADAPAAFWPMQETTGTAAFDLIGRNATVTLAGGAPAPISDAGARARDLGKPVTVLSGAGVLAAGTFVAAVNPGVSFTLSQAVTTPGLTSVRVANDASYVGSCALGQSGPQTGMVAADMHAGNGYVGVPDAPSIRLNGAQKATFEFILKAGTAPASPFRFVFDKSSAGHGYFDYTGGAGGVVVDFNGVNSALDSYVYDGNWHLWTVVWDVVAGSSVLTVYVDGAVLYSQNLGTPITMIADTTHPLTIGDYCQAPQSGNQFPGSWAGFALYPLALTSGQVATHYAAFSTAQQTIAPTGINSAIAMGAPSVALRQQTVAQSGINSSIAMGVPFVGQHGTGSSLLWEDFGHFEWEDGSYLLLEGPQAISLAGIDSSIRMGGPTARFQIFSRAVSGVYQILVRDEQTGVETQLTTGASLDKWWPVPLTGIWEGWFLYCATPAGIHDTSPTAFQQMTLRVARIADGSGDQQVMGLPSAIPGTSGNPWDRYGHPEPSPDGTKIAIFVATTSGASLIVEMSTVTWTVARLAYISAPGDGCTDPSYSPDNSKIVFTESVGGVQKVSTCSTSGALSATPQGGLANSYTVLQSSSPTAFPWNDPYYSPDGTKIVMLLQETAISLPTSLGVWSLRTMNANGTNLHTSFNDGSTISKADWEPNSKTLRTWGWANPLAGVSTLRRVNDDGTGYVNSGVSGQYPRYVKSKLTILPGAAPVTIPGIAAPIAMGSPSFTQTGGPQVQAVVGINSTIAMGAAPTFALSRVVLGGIDSTIQVGAPSFSQTSGQQSIALGGIDSNIALGAPVVSLASAIPSGIDSTIALGQPSFSQTGGPQSISLSGIPPGSVMGATPTFVTGPITVSVSGIASTGGMGTPTVTAQTAFPQSVGFVGIDSTIMMFPNITFSQTSNVGVAGIDSTIVLGGVSFSTSVTFTVPGISSTLAMGSTPLLFTLLQLFGPTGIDSTIQMGGAPVVHMQRHNWRWRVGRTRTRWSVGSTLAP